MSDPAFGKFMALQLVRLSGAVLALIGVVLLSGRFGTYPVLAGYLLVGVGLVDFFALPPLLAKRWKTKE